MPSTPLLCQAQTVLCWENHSERILVLSVVTAARTQRVKGGSAAH